MSRALHVRLDAEASTALKLLRSEAGTDSEAVRLDLREAAERRRRRSRLRDEVAALAADSADVDEMALVRDLMAELAPDRFP